MTIAPDNTGGGSGSVGGDGLTPMLAPPHKSGAGNEDIMPANVQPPPEQLRLAGEMGVADTFVIPSNLKNFADGVESLRDLSEEQAEELGVMIGLGIGVLSQYSQEQLDKMDPSTPGLPMLRALIQHAHSLELKNIPSSVTQATEKIYSERTGGPIGEKDATAQNQERLDLEKKGNVNKLGVTDSRRAEGAEAFETDSAIEAAYLEVGINPWLAPSLVVLLTRVTFELAEMESQRKAAEILLEKSAADMSWDMTQNAAAFIIAKGEVEKMQHIVNAVANGVSLGMSVVSVGGMAASMKGVKVNPTPEANAPQSAKVQYETTAVANRKADFRFESAKMLGTSAPMMSGVITNLSDAIAAGKKAEIDAAVELTRGARDIINQQVFQKAIEQWKEATDSIAARWDALLAATKALKEAINAGISVR